MKVARFHGRAARRPDPSSRPPVARPPPWCLRATAPATDSRGSCLLRWAGWRWWPARQDRADDGLLPLAERVVPKCCLNDSDSSISLLLIPRRRAERAKPDRAEGTLPPPRCALRTRPAPGDRRRARRARAGLVEQELQPLVFPRRRRSPEGWLCTNATAGGGAPAPARRPPAGKRSIASAPAGDLDAPDLLEPRIHQDRPELLVRQVRGRDQSTEATSCARSRRGRPEAGASATRRPNSRAARTRTASAELIRAPAEARPRWPCAMPAGRARAGGRPGDRPGRPARRAAAPRPKSPAAPSLRIRSAGTVPAQCSACATPRGSGGRQNRAPETRPPVSEPGAQREERLDLVVGLAQARRERANEMSRAARTPGPCAGTSALPGRLLDDVQRSRACAPSRPRCGACRR